MRCIVFYGGTKPLQNWGDFKIGITKIIIKKSLHFHEIAKRKSIQY